MAASALIIAEPGPLQESLRALVSTMPQIGAVDVMSDTNAGSAMGVSLCPALVLLDGCQIEGQPWLSVRRARTRWPGARIIVLVNSVEQQAEAEAAGADAVLLQGLPAGRLVAAMVRLLPQQVV